MSILDDAIDGNEQNYSPSAGGSRLDLILGDLDKLPKTDDFPQSDLDRLIEMLESPPTEWGHTSLLRTIRQLCAALEVDDRELTMQNVKQWRSKRRGDW